MYSFIFVQIPAQNKTFVDLKVFEMGSLRFSKGELTVNY